MYAFVLLCLPLVSVICGCGCVCVCVRADSLQNSMFILKGPGGGPVRHDGLYCLLRQNSTAITVSKLAVSLHAEDLNRKGMTHSGALSGHCWILLLPVSLTVS